MPASNGLLELEKSRDFFMDPGSYTTFYREERHRLIIGCIDPKDQDSDRLLTIVQTPGGGVGLGTDRAIAETAISGKIVTLKEGIKAENDAQPFVKMGAHPACRFIGGIIKVFDEMSHPTPFTETGTQFLIDQYDLGDEITPSLLTKVQDATKRLRECKYKEDELLSDVDCLEKTNNIVTMIGENTARIYVWNLHPRLGLDRHKKHREVGLKIQGYHDSIGATVQNLEKSRISYELKRLALGVHLLKASATRTVIGDPETEYYLVQPTVPRLQIVGMEQNN